MMTSDVGPTASPAPTRPCIVHVAESFASGTASAITDFVRNYPEASHHLVYSFRAEAKVHPRELELFASTTEMPNGTLARIRFLRRHLRDKAIVHAHSSKAGVYARVAVRRNAGRALVYTPHCYAFERRDVPRLERWSFWAAEWLLSFNTTAFGACSPREATLSRWPLRRPRVVAIPNVAPGGLPIPEQTTRPRRLRVVGNGRLGPQKDPAFFAAAIAAAAGTESGIDAIWVGDGDSRYVELLQANSVKVTGWLSRKESLEAMANGDLYLHSASWEGFPISILEAAGVGLAVVTRSRPYLSGFDMPAVVASPEDFATVIEKLNRPGALEALRVLTAEALAGNTDEHQRAALAELYGPLITNAQN